MTMFVPGAGGVTFLVADGVVADDPLFAGPVLADPFVAGAAGPDARVEYRDGDPGAGDTLFVQLVRADHGGVVSPPGCLVRQDRGISVPGGEPHRTAFG